MRSIDVGELADRRVGDVMVTVPKVHRADLSVAGAREVLADDHVHMVLLVDADERLVGTVVRDDLIGAAGGADARGMARLEDRVVTVDQRVGDVLVRLRGTAGRRLAVLDEAERLVGLLCLKRSRRGFCDDAGVRSRAAERAGSGQR